MKPLHRLRRQLAAALLALPLSMAAVAASTPPPRSPASFDALFAELDAQPRAHGDNADKQAQHDRLRALLPPDDAAREIRYQALRCGVGLYDDPSRVAADAQARLAQAQRLGDVDAQVRLHYCIGDALENQRDEREAADEYTRGIDLARGAGLARLHGEGLELRAGTLSILGEQARALLDFMQAQRVYEQAGLTAQASANVLGLGVAYRRMGEFDEALAHLRRSERSARGHRDWQTVYTSLLQQGYLHYDLGDGPASLTALQQALDLAELESFPRDAVLARIALAASHGLVGEHARALSLLDRARRALDALGGSTHMSLLLDLRRGEALAGLGRHREALEHYARVQAALAGSDNLRYRIMLHRAHAASLDALGRMPDALAEYRRLLDAETALERITAGQLETLMRHQFDIGRRDAEHRRLASEKTLHEQQLRAGQRARGWQYAALAGSALLLLVLAGLGLRQRRRGRRLHALAMTDPLTGAANRRSLERFAAGALSDARLAAQPLSVIALDVDHFKRINDRYGHAAGDDVLRRVAEACQRELRRDDLLGRTGGEEFVAVLPGTSLDSAQRIAQRLLTGIETLDLQAVASGLTITASLGVAEFLPGNGDFRELLQRADAALYRAKRNGRNRVECDDGPVPVEVPSAPEAQASSKPSEMAAAPAAPADA